MKIALSTRIVALLLSTLVAVNSPAQESDESAAPITPDLTSLQSDWWTYFEGPRETIEPNIDTFLEDVGAQIASLAPQNQEIAESVMDAVRDNFTAYLALLDYAATAPQTLDEPAANYSLDDLLALAATARDAQSNAEEEQLEVEREKRILDGASRRRDAMFKEHVDAPAGDERWLVAA